MEVHLENLELQDSEDLKESVGARDFGRLKPESFPESVGSLVPPSCRW
jgi:hypothetical protein